MSNINIFWEHKTSGCLFQELERFHNVITLRSFGIGTSVLVTEKDLNRFCKPLVINVGEIWKRKGSSFEIKIVESHNDYVLVIVNTHGTLFRKTILQLVQYYCRKTTDI